ncbi:hypothetical protein AB6A40_009528 [Gnathostoma spinigerum]|uniref:F-box domain-containing protein n=1 Tax=Gnathostoma spinigerum TaxID=75299 RepID=A0ABD6EZQ1_9BILA
MANNVHQCEEDCSDLRKSPMHSIANHELLVRPSKSIPVEDPNSLHNFAAVFHDCTAFKPSKESDLDEAASDNEEWFPYCFVKTTNSKEFVGCTSMSEAFHRLDLVRSVKNVRRFTYICKVVQILIEQKLHNLSATARKSLLSILQAIVVKSVEQDVHISTARSLVSEFGVGLDGHVCGSPKLVSKELDKVGDLLEVIAERRPLSLADSDEESTTFLDLPREVLSIILRKLPDHVSLLEIAKTHEVMQAIVESEWKLWSTLCRFHFTTEQIAQYATPNNTDWRHTFFQLKKYFGLRDVYTDLIHICCHCKALFWKETGHPCLSKDAPSVRVPPQQFVDMLLFL